MLRTQLALIVAVAGSAILLQAQGVENFPSKGGPFRLHARTVVVSADEQELVNAATQERQLRGNIRVRPRHRPVTQVVAAANAAGASFPSAQPVRALVRGRLEIVIDDLVIRADEADINASQGDMDLRGNVTVALVRNQ